MNLFRWKSHYFDPESKLYYISGRYYDPETSLYLNAADVSGITDYATTASGLDRNGLMCDNIHKLLPYLYAIFTIYELAPDPEYVPDSSGGIEWWHWLIAIGIIITISLVTAGAAAGIGWAIGAASLTGATAATSAGCMALSLGVSAFASGVIAGGVNLAFQSILNNEINFGELAIGTAFGAVTGAFGGSSLGVGWQIGINMAAGLSSYSLVQLTRGEEITFGGAIASTILGAFSGLIGGHGSMYRGGALASATFWRSLAPGVKSFANAFNKALIKNSVTGFIRGTLWSVFNDWYSDYLKKKYGW